MIDFPTWPEMLYSFKFSISKSLVVQFCYRKGVYAEKKEEPGKLELARIRYSVLEQI